MADNTNGDKPDAKQSPGQTSAPKPDVPSSPGSAISEHLDSFITRIDSLAETLPLAMLAIGRARKDSQKAFTDFIETRCTIQKEEGVLSVPVDVHSEFLRLRGQLNKSAIAHVSVPRSFLVALISDYDAFLSGLIKILFRLQPGALNTNDKTFSYSDLSDFSTIEAVREYVVEKQIENVLRDSHAEQFKWLETKFKLELRRDLKSWPDFIEITERRNLFVHNDGIATKHYLDICKEQGADCASVAKGEALKVTSKYFTHAHAIVFEIATKLAHVLWRKLLPGEREEADRHLAGQVIYELISQSRYELAAVMADFGAETFKKFATDYHRKMLAINHAQAHKWLGNAKLCEDILRAQDWTAAKDEFRICVECLKDDFGEAVRLMHLLGSAADRPGKAGYRDWPIFKEIRKEASFQHAFREIFGEPLNIVPADKDEAPKPELPPPPSEPPVLH